MQAVVVHGNTVTQVSLFDELDEDAAETLAEALQANVKAAYAKLSDQVR
ncbi:hypothetical protein GCM10025863_22340 [Microbacterium suwonense]|uniref:Uncharacterized protein n=1 Tax=Microbacterium suwonense TaxID=683047 RepID=A0ABN6X4C0_9MICO|nr:hypothetical protein GCM10025863_22340 [Microbacterium suwonense]